MKKLSLEMNYFLKVTPSLSDGGHSESRHSGEEHNGGHKKREEKGDGEAGGDTQGRNNQDCSALIDMHILITLAAGVTARNWRILTSVRFSLDNKKPSHRRRVDAPFHPQAPGVAGLPSAANYNPHYALRGGQGPMRGAHARVFHRRLEKKKKYTSSVALQPSHCSHSQRDAVVFL